MDETPDMPAHFVDHVHEAICQGIPLVTECFVALGALHADVPLETIEEWTARILWRFKHTDLALAS
jgi:hypothetical protein